MQQLARQKAEDVFAGHGDDTVIGADTVVYFDGKVLGKPADEEDAKRTLRALSGKTHSVYTGWCVLHGKEREQGYSRSDVTFCKLSEEFIEEYLKYYNKALQSIFYENEKYWPVYYALAVSYDKNNEWSKAEESLQKALKLSNRHPQVLNYLGYSWLKYDVNTDNAAAMILEAYEKDPNDGVIMDSLGWVYFKTGDYQNAIVYLEKASELNPQNAIISDHLGDAYWYGGRKNEAVFLWKQALTQKDDQEELNVKQVKNKIENGLKKTQSLLIKDEKIRETLHSLNNITE